MPCPIHITCSPNWPSTASRPASILAISPAPVAPADAVAITSPRVWFGHVGLEFACSTGRRWRASFTSISRYRGWTTRLCAMLGGRRQMPVSCMTGSEPTTTCTACFRCQAQFACHVLARSTAAVGHLARVGGGLMPSSGHGTPASSGPCGRGQAPGGCLRRSPG